MKFIPITRKSICILESRSMRTEEDIKMTLQNGNKKLFSHLNHYYFQYLCDVTARLPDDFR